MIISLTNRFVHVANLKVASTSIEITLRSNAEIALVEAQFGKHFSIQQIQDHFGWLFMAAPISDFFIFGVIREPVSYVLSLYNSHSDERFIDRPSLYTGNMEFTAFLETWFYENDMMRPQCERFLGHHRLLGINYAVPYELLTERLQFLSERTGVSALRNIPVEHVSPVRVVRQHLTKAHLDWIAANFALDFDFRMRYCDKCLPAFEIEIDSPRENA